MLELDQRVDSLERMNREMAQQVEAYYASKTTPPSEKEGEIFVQTADGKGVPIRRPADASPIAAHEHQPGPKPDRKKMATVGAMYRINRLVRTLGEVVQSLFRDPQQDRPKTQRPHRCRKPMRAMLNHTDMDGQEVDGRAGGFG